MNKPLPRSSYSKAYNENYERIFGRRVTAEDFEYTDEKCPDCGKRLVSYRNGIIVKCEECKYVLASG